MRSRALALLLVLLPVACGDSGDPKPTRTVAGYDPRADALLLRKTYNVNVNRPDSGPLMASDGEATDAAHRIFSSFHFEGASREGVLKLLGDPRTISDYAKREEYFRKDRLVYHFDSGFGGMQYILHFEDGRVREMEKQSLE